MLPRLQKEKRQIRGSLENKNNANAKTNLHDSIKGTVAPTFRSSDVHRGRRAHPRRPGDPRQLQLRRRLRAPVVQGSMVQLRQVILYCTVHLINTDFIIDIILILL